MKNIKDARSEKGPGVGDRVKQIRATNKAVDAALEAFEKKGHKPKFDEAFSFTGKVEQPRQVAMRKSHHASRQTSVSDDGVEIIFTTVVDLYNEWQGTTIANFYDASGALEQQYVADVVITRSEYVPSDWTARYELKFESDGIGYLNHRPGMFTDFNLGTPILQQSAPLTLDPAQFASTEQMNAYYDLYPNQLLIDNPGGGDGRGGGIQPIQQARLVKYAHRAKPQWARGPTISPWAFNTVTGWGNMAKDVGIGCSFAAGACAVGVLLGGISAAGCLGTACTLVTLNAARNNLRVVRR
ncbi:MAG TPA: hypothetical protein VHS05_15865 [Pyrinomonadaceae bacterium]|nr:hypothetical protein [Pyrinomonadaceae bacterium]